MFKVFLRLQIALLSTFLSLSQTLAAPNDQPVMVGSAINALGVDLLHQTGRVKENVSLSPYSIETVLAMTYAGADGKTRAEMAHVLHLNGDDSEIANAFAALQKQIDELFSQSAKTSTPMTLNVANRLYGQKGYDFRPTFLDLLKTQYHAPFEAMDFRNNSSRATSTINDWVAKQTRQRIKDLIPSGALNDLTRLVLVNAVYLKVTWSDPFEASATKPLPFHVAGSTTANVPTMNIQKSFGYKKMDDVTIVSLPYSGRELQFLIILPNDANGLAKVEAGLSADKLAQWRALPEQPVRLFLPKFKLEPPTLPLGDALRKLGMTTAFDNPRGSANFDRIASRRPNDYLYISDVFHKTFVNVDEKGTEAAAATGVAMMMFGGAPRPVEPVEVRVDHPFLFAIQHRASGACLFLGHVVNPK